MIIPSLDFIHGKIVRLYQGNYNNKISYKKDIFKQIEKYIYQGATYIHLVDLDGCNNPENRQKSMFNIFSNFKNVSFQVGGGIRSKRDIENLFHAGVSKIVIGTSAILYPNKFKKWLKNYGSKNFVLSVDININTKKENKIAIQGWKKTTEINLDDAIKQFIPYGLKNILCTDISRDGTFSGPNISLYKYLKNKFPNIVLQSSGGINSISDIYNLKKNNVEHVIVGRALLENKFTFLEASKCWLKE
ncbi:1-(5-phosphoribosyl)-5-[(5-phosphoribosylamino)methylideneamino]imidazole-4-carboxamide isomerase [Buchnera aphidicola]|uniref:1-(5-phosphoribosyl)-5-[(5-phosphoribosylamino)methylideneamino] imidazole-4-carboxamide isomerase n=1 Tax=Buchnera aphidicola subsp. Cinara cedri (strain Cc) TaxID=372461 RepID=HIS4_BUCCC|nr:1-(5-phosphoribosyl)-5-[(5-phosphoribosylamino)methylideneamino]imidazole-4-carboxamide isomerase [Buchnera aphidicola]Q058A3.1 RecName: Full=1-(5-phosphoribosyl)-5-[(5-phosphoribosylamino)methylideneamino] imidazole-4-carboxamide isomerase; AltName: Full=Phosphoribosylformimino-5-aminoimidazole carboxamide ribotide isomerase [Buchnera aphidicola BCc]ABJ90546.1 phosphoribosylformimino-5-aminoimidazole carboxamide ribotide isomerase [Buchnera aphidicola BCc]